MEVRLHVVKHHVDILIVLRFNDIQQSYDILMPVEFLQEHDLPEGPLGIGCIVKGVEDLFNRDHLFIFLIDGLPDDPIRALADLLDYLEFPEDVWLNLVRHFLRGLEAMGSHLRFRIYCFSTLFLKSG